MAVVDFHLEVLLQRWSHSEMIPCRVDGGRICFAVRKVEIEWGHCHCQVQATLLVDRVDELKAINQKLRRC